MVENYLKISWRNIRKGRIYSIINILGLALGLFCALLIGLWIHDEWSVNRFFPDIDRIYAVRINQLFNGNIQTGMLGAYNLEEAIQEDVPGIEAATKMGYASPMLFQSSRHDAKEEGWFVSAGFFDVFAYPSIAGNAAEAIKSVDQIVITRTTALKYFNTVQAVGQSLQINRDKHYLVGAVIEDPVHQSSFQFAWVLNIEINKQPWMENWGNSSFATYVKLKKGVEAPVVEQAMSGIYKRHKEGLDYTPVLQKMTDVYLYGRYVNGYAAGGRISYLYVFGSAALFVLIIACVNFMNLATARSARRAKEVGVLKAIGAGRKNLIGQFLSESTLVTFISIMLALMLVAAFLPSFNSFFTKQLRIPVESVFFWGGVIALGLFTALLAGSYPAFFLSAFRPVEVLKGTTWKSGKNSVWSTLSIRKLLVIFQFVLSVLLIAGILGITIQLKYIQGKDLGMARENVIYLPLEGGLYKQLETVRLEAGKLASVESATTVSMLPMNIQSTSGDLRWEGKAADLETSVTATWVGYDFPETLSIPIVSGRSFSPAHPSDSINYLINETAARYMGMDDPVGQYIEFWNGKAPIVGVMKDFHMESLHAPIKPLIVVLRPENSSFLMVRTKSGALKEAIADLSKLSKEFNPDYPFEFHFVDEAYEAMYRTEQQVGIIARYFGVLAISISCLGLFALVAYTAEQRAKEVSIRKVIGASVGDIVQLLSTDFLRLVIVAIVLALPIAYWSLSRWLDSFEYRASMGPGIFLAASIISISLALITVGAQAFKAARANPVNNLKDE